MLLTLVSLKGNGVDYISYEELQKPVLISGCLLQEGRKGFTGVGGPRDYYRQGKKTQDLLVQLLSDKG